MTTENKGNKGKQRHVSIFSCARVSHITLLLGFWVFGDFGVFGVWLCISSRDRSQSHIYAHQTFIGWPRTVEHALPRRVFNRAWPANERLMRCGRAVDKNWKLLNHTPLANNWELLISAYAP